MTSGFKDYFSATAQDYARYRPQYPSALYDFVASLVSRHDAAWDCATGNGQVALGLTPHFRHIYATDASKAQIDNAFPHPSIGYSVGLAEASGLPDQCADIVTIGSAMHWLDPDRFYPEVYRVVRPGGAIAMWCIERPSVPHTTPKLQAAIAEFYTLLEPVIPPEIKLVQAGYQTLPFPFEEVETPQIIQTVEWTANELVGYFSTWSATQHFVQRYGPEAIAQRFNHICLAWGDRTTAKAITWPMFLRAGRLTP
ncbi:class I SAM-dependent methyltransferase [Leptolyngbya sp. AN02str]|uniref:class I SAM-dependent methyltransferase n=1 Tax=Leptolyngbya sp. AN02str TaxID=3423363 RepID=UPI003D31E153